MVLIGGLMEVERYNYVFDQYDGDSFIYDLKEDKRIEDLSECADILNKQRKIIKELMEKNANTQTNAISLSRQNGKSRLSNQYFIRLSNERAIKELNDIKKVFTAPHLTGKGQKTFSVNRLEKMINAKIGELVAEIEVFNGY